MRLAIVDDEEETRTELSEYAARFSREAQLALSVRVFPSGDAFLSSFHTQYDIIIFDIDMPGPNGIETARKVRAVDEEVVILFITNVARYAINGYEVDAVDYCLKPLGYYEFAMKFQKAVRRASRREKTCLVLDTPEGQISIPAAELLFVEAQGHYLVYHTQEREYLVRGSMAEHEKTLAARHFTRAHKSFLVNLAKVQNMKAGALTVGGRAVPLGRAYKEQFTAAYMRYIRG